MTEDSELIAYSCINPEGQLVVEDLPSSKFSANILRLPSHSILLITASYHAKTPLKMLKRSNARCERPSVEWDLAASRHTSRLIWKVK